MINCQRKGFLILIVTSIFIFVWIALRHVMFQNENILKSLEKSFVVSDLWINIPGRPAHLFSAYYDSRDKNKHAIIRVHSLVHYKHWRERLHCKLFYGINGVCSGVAEPALFNPHQYTKEGQHFYWAVQYICQLEDLVVPDSVTLYVNADCSDVQNYSIKVSNNMEPIPGYQKKTFGLCLARLHNFDKPRDLFDAFENNRFFGVEPVTVYRGNVSQGTNELLQRYVDEGHTDIVPFILPDKVASQIISNGQHLAINECLYRNMNKVKYLVYTDTDEIIIPRNHTNWEEMIASLSSDNIGVYMFRNAFFIQGNKTKGINAFQTWTTRSKAILPPVIRSKIMVEPTKLISMTIHNPIKLMPGYQTKVADITTGLMHHYRRNIPPPYHKNPLITDDYAVRQFATSYNKTYQERLEYFKDILSKYEIH